MIEIQYDDRPVIEALQKLLSKTSNLNPVLKAIGEDLQESTKRRFETSSGPDGSAWAKNSPATLEHKSGSRPLVDVGTLMDTIHYQVHDNVLELGSGLPYAAMQQFGGEKSEFPHLWGDIPARPFLGVSKDDEKAILDTLADYLALL